MGGIFGYVLGGLSPRPSLEAACRSLGHRGPDGHGVFEDAERDPVCGLAHTRLAVIDLTPGGHQPMQTGDRRYTITFNGEIYNYEAIRRELKAAGQPAPGDSDTAVILGAYARWGGGALDRLRGMFAFAIWDRLERRLFVARDRLGAKPLYLARVPAGLLFASEVRTLLGTGQIDRRLDRQALVDYLAFGSVREPGTLVKGISMLPAGTFAEYHGGALRERQYWAPPLRIDRMVSFRDAVEETRALLLDATSLRLVSDVPVGILLSGGTESAASVALAAQVARSPIHTFTVTFEEAAHDQSSFARDVARRFGAEHHVLPLSSKAALEQMDGALAAQDQPSAHGTIPYFVARGAHQAGLAVALSGIGGDEILGASAGFRRFPRWLATAPALRTLPALGSRWPPGRFLLPARVRKAAGLLATQGHPFAMYSLLRGMFSRAERTALMGGDTGVVAPSTMDQAIADWLKGSDGDAVEAFGTFELTNHLRQTRLRDADVLGMAQGLEIREPFLDDRLIERTMTLPGRMKVASGGMRPLLAQVLPELPQAKSRRSGKGGLSLPVEAWLRGPLRGWAKETLFGGHSSTCAPLDAVAVRDAWRGFEQGRVSYSRIWTLIALERWCVEHRMSS